MSAVAYHDAAPDIALLGVRLLLASRCSRLHEMLAWHMQCAPAIRFVLPILRSILTRSTASIEARHNCSCVRAVSKTSGSVIGVTIGCLLGMLPLLWMDTDKREGEKAKEQGGNTIARHQPQEA